MTSLNEKQIVDIFVNNFRRSNRMITGGFRSRRYYTTKPIGEDDVSIISLARSLSRGMELIFKCDTLVESTDVPPGMKAWQIARKRIVASVRGLAANGIKP